MRTRTIAEMESAQTPVVESLRQENAKLRSLLHEAKIREGSEEQILHELLEAVQVSTPPVVKYKPPARGKVKSPCALVIHLTDWHIGQVTRPQHIEEFGAYNYGLAVERINALLAKLLAWTELHRQSYTIDGVVVLGTADWISGDIHQELVATNEFPAPEQAVNAGYLLGAFLLQLSAAFSSVRAELITCGNHDRLTKKPQSSDGGLNSWGYVVSAIARENVKLQKSVRVNIHPQTHKVVEVSGQRYLIAHGDGIQGTWGIPYYGIERQKQREAMARMNRPPDTHFDKIVIGHFHSALNHEHWLIGGSLSGTTAFDHKCGRHSPPHQTAWFVHPEHGEFDWSRWWL
jgi:hypothetical protein